MRGPAVVAGTGSTGSGPSLIAEAGGAAILAVEGPAHPDTTYSAPSLTVTAPIGRTGQGGIPVVMVEGAKHSLLEYEFSTSWHSGQRESANWDYSAPSLVLGDPATELAFSYEGTDHGLVLTYFNVAARSWQNDVVTVIDNAYSAPVVAVRAGHPAGELDIVDQGPSNELRYYSAAQPGSSSVASFTGHLAAGQGTTFGG